MSCYKGAADVAVKYAICAIVICKQGDVEIPPVNLVIGHHSELK